MPRHSISLCFQCVLTMTPTCRRWLHHNLHVLLQGFWLQRDRSARAGLLGRQAWRAPAEEGASSAVFASPPPSPAPLPLRHRPKDQVEELSAILHAMQPQ